MDTNLAKCSSCDSVFDFLEQMEGHSKSVRPEVEPPKNIQLQPTLDGLEIVRSWFTPKVYALLVFCVFWDGFMVVWFGIAITQQQWLMAAFGTIHGAVGAGLTYLLICSFMNRTHIRMSLSSLTISHKPLPWSGGKVIPVGEVKQVFTKEKIHRGKNGTSYTYGVWFQDQTSIEHKLVTGLNKPDQALYIEQEIEKTLGIIDAEIRGELHRN